MKKLSIVFFVVFAAINVMAQQDQQDKKEGMPNIPGSLLFEYGSTLLTTHSHDTIKNEWFKSNSINVYYLYEFPIGKGGKFSFHPGIGVGTDKIAFKRDRGIFNAMNADSVRETTIKLLETALPNGSSFKKSKLGLTYIDVPLEFRFVSNPDDKNRSLKIAVGGRIGFLVNQKTKIKYTSTGDANGDTEKLKLKSHQDFGITQFRYGTTFRLGIGALNLFYYHNFSPLFKPNKGPDNTKVSTYTIGLTISGF